MRQLLGVLFLLPLAFAAPVGDLAVFEEVARSDRRSLLSASPPPPSKKSIWPWDGGAEEESEAAPEEEVGAEEAEEGEEEEESWIVRKLKSLAQQMVILVIDFLIAIFNIIGPVGIATLAGGGAAVGTGFGAHCNPRGACSPRLPAHRVSDAHASPPAADVWRARGCWCLPRQW